MGSLFGWIMIIGAIGTSAYYWVTRGRYEQFLIGRTKTTCAFFFWYLFVVYLAVNWYRSWSRRSEPDETKERILD